MTTVRHEIPAAVVRLHGVENVTSWHTHMRGHTSDGEPCVAEVEFFPATTIGVLPTVDEVLVALRGFEEKYHIGAFIVAGSMFGCDRARIDDVTGLTFSTVKPAGRLVGTIEQTLRIYDNAPIGYRCVVCTGSWKTGTDSTCSCPD